MSRFSVESRGYHVYHDLWDAAIGERLSCQRERSILYDRFAVSVVKNGVIVGHIPRKISAVSLIFLQHGGCIRCEVTGPDNTLEIFHRVDWKYPVFSYLKEMRKIS